MKALAIIVIAVLLFGLTISEPVHAIPTPKACMTEVLARAAQLGINGWLWIEDNEHKIDAAAFVDPATHSVHISDFVSCELAVSVANHEWAHTRQMDTYGERTTAAYGDELEIIADCASMLLESTYTPYIARKKTKECFGCTQLQLISARNLLK